MHWRMDALAYGCVGVRMHWRAGADDCKEKRKENLLSTILERMVLNAALACKCVGVRMRWRAGMLACGCVGEQMWMTVKKNERKNERKRKEKQRKLTKYKCRSRWWMRMRMVLNADGEGRDGWWRG